MFPEFAFAAVINKRRMINFTEFLFAEFRCITNPIRTGDNIMISRLGGQLCFWSFQFPSGIWIVRKVF